MTTQLSETQTMILHTACARKDRAVFPLPAEAALRGGAVAMVCRSLARRGLVEEVDGSDGFRATDEAFSVLGLRPDRQPPRQREGTRQAALIAMLRSPDGATVDEIAAAMEWRAHTVRGAISGALKKRHGLTVTSEKVDGRGRVYRIKS